MSEKSHVVFRLVAHSRSFLYQEGREEQAIARASTKYETLTVWFPLKCVDE